MGIKVLAGRYELIKKLGEGGMSVVFKAKDRFLNRFVAIKVLRPEYIKDDSFIESFLRESQVVAGVVDPNIVQVYDVGQEGNIHYIVMEYIEGQTLSELIKEQGRLDSHTVVSYSKQIAMALTTAHANHLIHRDIKPHNIMITTDGMAKLTDFGIAKKINPNDHTEDENEAVMGSIHYFSPEQARGNAVDERSDIYSLGIVMYEMITGRVPFDGDNPVDVAVKHMNEEMVPPSKYAYEMPQDLEDIILKATSKDPEDRFANAEELLISLNLIKYSRLVDFDREVLEETEIKEDDDTVIKKNRSKFSLIACALLLLVPIFGGFFDIVTGLNSNVNKTVKVPKLVSMSYEDAEALLKTMNLSISLESEVSNDFYGPGIVVSQYPSDGSTVKEGHTIKVNITRRIMGVKVPNVYKENLESAKQRLENLGFKIGIVYKDPNEEIEKDCIIATDPAIGTIANQGASINLYVSLGGDNGESYMNPVNLQGLTLKEAKKLIESNGGVLDKVSYRAAEGSYIEPGCVIEQSPKKNAQYKIDEVIHYSLTLRNVVKGEVTLEVDVSNLSKGSHKISIIIEDSFDNYDGKTQYNNVSFVKSASDKLLKYKVTGKGIGSAIVIIDGVQSSYNLNFNKGTFELVSLPGAVD